MQAIAIQMAGCDRALDGAAGFALMAAVAKSALGGQRFDIREGCLHALSRRPELERPHARRVNEQSSRRENQQMAASGGMASSAVV